MFFDNACITKFPDFLKKKEKLLKNFSFSD